VYLLTLSVEALEALDLSVHKSRSIQIEVLHRTLANPAGIHREPSVDEQPGVIRAAELDKLACPFEIGRSRFADSAVGRRGDMRVGAPGLIIRTSWWVKPSTPTAKETISQG